MKFIRLFEEIGIKDINSVGGKNASLGEMINNLSSAGINIPSGFAITSDGYKYHLEKNNLITPITRLLEKLDKKNINQLTTVGREIRSLIRTAPLPDELIKEIGQAYKKLEERYGVQCDVAVRSSATAEDLPEASFAGQQESYLNIKGERELLLVCPDAYASLFTNRAISYHIDNGFDHMSVFLSIGVQKMVRSDKACSGVIFTLDTESGFPDVIFITASYGLGENIVKGTVNPDEFYVHKITLKQKYSPLLKKRLGSKTIKMIYANDGRATTQNIDTTKKERAQFSLSNDEILNLARQAMIIEDFYSKNKGSWCPMDIEWAKDGDDGKLYIVQARPETVHSLKQAPTYHESYVLEKSQVIQPLLMGKSIGRKIVQGKARIIESPKQMNLIQEGDILVTDMTDPDWEPVMKISAGIVTNRGGRTCHAAIISRELGIPAIVGSGDATAKIKNGQVITLDCSNGEVGAVYDGSVPFSVKKIEYASLPKLPVDIFINIGNPDEAFNLTRLPVNGVGLARLEFIINNSIQIHPMALLHPEKILDFDERRQIELVTSEYEDKKQFFIDKIAQEAGTIVAAFYPKPVFIRLSDFKSNEYKQLIAGRYFEPKEENPMIGFRGAARYIHPKYKEVFTLECKAMKKIREEMGLTNVKVMIPFVRTIGEAQAVLSEMRVNGLSRGDNGLEVYMTCELPSNVVLIDQFCEYFDGFSIGSNDLTQTTLAVDRDSELMAATFDERNPAVKFMLEMAIKGAKRNKKKISICGQGPSDYPELAQFLISCGIDSLSLTADAVLRTMFALSKVPDKK
jgi:pyruvate,water dikinase